MHRPPPSPVLFLCYVPLSRIPNGHLGLLTSSLVKNRHFVLLVINQPLSCDWKLHTFKVGTSSNALMVARSEFSFACTTGVKPNYIQGGEYIPQLRDVRAGISANMAADPLTIRHKGTNIYHQIILYYNDVQSILQTHNARMHSRYLSYYNVFGFTVGSSFEQELHNLCVFCLGGNHERCVAVLRTNLWTKTMECGK